MPPRPRRERILGILNNPEYRGRIPGWDLVLMAMVLGPDPGGFSLREVARALLEAGYDHPGGPEALLSDLLALPSDSNATTPDQRYSIAARPWSKQLTALLAAYEPPELDFPPSSASSPRSKRGAAGAGAPGPAARAAAATTRAPSARASAGPPSGRAAAGARASAPSSSPTPAPPEPPPPPPPAPPPTPPAMTFEGVTAASSWTQVSPAQLHLAAMAHRLAIAQSFDELLAPAVMVGFTPHRYQLETARKVLRVLRGRAMLSDEVGLGKTIEALLVLREYQLRGLARRGLVLVPAPLVPQWVGELEAKAGVEASTFDENLQSPEEFWASEGVLVVSMALARSARHAPLAQGQAWDMVVVDEAHHVKNRTTLGWKLIDGLKSRFLLLLTATPIEKSLEEIYNLVTLLRPGQFKTVQAFRKEYVDPKNPTSPKNRERLRGLLAEVMIRNTRAQSGLRLPPRYVSTVAIDTSPTKQSLYAAVVALLREHHGELSARLTTTTLLLEAGSSTAALRSTLEKMSANPRHKAAFRSALRTLAEQAGAVDSAGKLRAMEAILVENPGKVLIFTRFRETLREVESRLRALGLDAVSFHGGMDGRAKQAALGAFRAGSRVLVASDVGGEGQNLQFCSTLINYDLPWNPMLIEQRIGRLHRMGQEHEVRVYNLCARGTAEERVLDVLDRRVHLFELVVGEMDMVLGNLEDDRDLEERVIDLYARSQSDAEVARGFDQLAAELLAARGRYERTRAFDEALFGKDYEA